jgi:hypothetical protein
VRALKAEVEKGFVRTAVGHELIDPKAEINIAKVGTFDRVQSLSGVGARSSRVVQDVERESGLIFLNLCVGCLRRRERTRKRAPLPRKEFSLLFDAQRRPWKRIVRR